MLGWRARFPQQHNSWICEGFSQPGGIRPCRSPALCVACHAWMLNDLGSGDLHWCCGKSLAVRGWGLACPLSAPTIRVGTNLSSVHGTWPNAYDEIEEAAAGLIWWGGGTEWIWCYSSVLDMCDLADVCGVSVPSHCLCQDAEWFRAITFISSQKWDCSLVASCHCWNSAASPQMGSSFDIVWSCDTKQTRCSHPIDLNITSVLSFLTIEKSFHLTCLWIQSFVLK